jgi:hypothetical protein
MQVSNICLEKHDLPPFLERNKELCISIKTYVRENLAEPSSEMLCHYLHNTLLAIMIKEETGIEKGGDGYIDMLKEILYKHGLTKIFSSMCYHWLRLLGFTYCAQKKGYFMDGHEKPATVAYPKEIISHYLTYKRKTYSWVRLPKTEALDLQENGGILKDTGFSYTDSVDKKMLSIMLMICTKQKNRISKTINKVLVAT